MQELYRPATYRHQTAAFNLPAARPPRTYTYTYTPVSHAHAPPQALGRETLTVWCAMAERLGLFAVKAELEDLCFAVLHPTDFASARTRLDLLWGVRPTLPASTLLRLGLVEEAGEVQRWVAMDEAKRRRREQRRQQLQRARCEWEGWCALGACGGAVGYDGMGGFSECCHSVCGVVAWLLC